MGIEQSSKSTYTIQLQQSIHLGNKRKYVSNMAAEDTLADKDHTIIKHSTFQNNDLCDNQLLKPYHF